MSEFDHGEETGRLKATVEDHARRLGDLERDNEKHKSWRNWVLGSAATIGGFIGFFADRFKHIFGG